MGYLSKTNLTTVLSVKSLKMVKEILTTSK